MLGTKWKNSIWIPVLILCFGWLAVSISIFRVGLKPKEVEVTDVFEILNAEYIRNMLNKMERTPELLEDVSTYQVEEYRYMYGELGSQVEDIVNQYEGKIEHAKKEEKEKILTKRNNKIDAVVANFSDDSIVKQKIIKERRAWLAKNGGEIQRDLKMYDEFSNDNYVYHFVDDKGNVLTNVSGLGAKASKKEIETAVTKQGVGQLSKDNIFFSGGYMDEKESIPSYLFSDWNSEATGMVMIKKGSPESSSYAEEVKRSERSRIVLFNGVFLLIVGLTLTFRCIKLPRKKEKVSHWVNKCPIDVRVMSVIISFIGIAFIPFGIPSEARLRGSIMSVLFALVLCLLLVGFIAWTVVVIRNSWWNKQSNESSLSIRKQWANSFYIKGTQFLIQGFLRWPVGIRIFLMVIFGVCIASSGFVFMISGSELIIGGLLLIFVLTLLLIYPLSGTIKKADKLLQQPKEILASIDEAVSSKKDLAGVEENLEVLQQIVQQSRLSNQQSEQLKAELLTNVSHDLRTPLTSLITYGDLLTKDGLTEQDREEYVQIINQKTLRMKALIDDLFDVTKMNNGEISIEKQPVNMGQLLQQSVAEYGEEFEKAQLKLFYTKPFEPIMIQVDGEKMWRVFDNLIGNVIKYALAGTRVHLKLSEDTNNVTIEMKNISNYELNEDGQTLVERFKRGDDSRHTEGSGLGLAIVNSIIDLHGGTLDIEVDGDMFKVLVSLPKE